LTLNKDMLRGAWLSAKDLDEGIKASTEGLRRLLENDTTGIIRSFLTMNEAYEKASSRVLYYLEQAGVHQIATKEDEI